MNPADSDDPAKLRAIIYALVDAQRSVYFQCLQAINATVTPEVIAADMIANGDPPITHDQAAAAIRVLAPFLYRTDEQ